MMRYFTFTLISLVIAFKSNCGVMTIMKGANYGTKNKYRLFPKGKETLIQQRSAIGFSQGPLIFAIYRLWSSYF